MTLYVEQMGQGPDLVMVHGWGMNGAVFDAVGSELAQHFRVHILDLPGYGLSPEPVTTLEALLDALLSVLPDRSHSRACSAGSFRYCRPLVDHHRCKIRRQRRGEKSDRKLHVLRGE